MTDYDRRVASKTFTILGASTPDFRISTTWASRKMKIMNRLGNYKKRRSAVSKMHNGSLQQDGLIACHRHAYVCGKQSTVGI